MGLLATPSSFADRCVDGDCRGDEHRSQIVGVAQIDRLDRELPSINCDSLRLQFEWQAEGNERIHEKTVPVEETEIVAQHQSAIPAVAEMDLV